MPCRAPNAPAPAPEPKTPSLTPTKGKGFDYATFETLLFQLACQAREAYAGNYCKRNSHIYSYYRGYCLGKRLNTFFCEHKSKDWRCDGTGWYIERMRSLWQMVEAYGSGFGGAREGVEWPAWREEGEGEREMKAAYRDVDRWVVWEWEVERGGFPWDG